VPALPSSVIDPLWSQFSGLLPDRVVVHPLGCHRPRIPDRVVFDKLVQALVFGAAYDKVADSTCSAITIRGRRDEWITAGVFDRLGQLCLGAYDRIVGLDLTDLSVDGCITKAPCGGEVAGKSPVDRGKQAPSARCWSTDPVSRSAAWSPPRTGTTRRCCARPWRSSAASSAD